MDGNLSRSSSWKEIEYATADDELGGPCHYVDHGSWILFDWILGREEGQMNILTMMKRWWLLHAAHSAAAHADWVGEIMDYDLELEIRKATDPHIRAAWEAVKKGEQKVPQRPR